jgi:hypothetical protein
MLPRIASLPSFPALVLAALVATTSGAVAQSDAARIPSELYECLHTARSNVDFYLSNYGPAGHDVGTSGPGAFWPRDSRNSYLYGGGFWFGARRRVGDSLVDASVVGYNASTGGSWFVPGGSHDTVVSANLHRLYDAESYDRTTGEALDEADRSAGGPRWPVWTVTAPNDIGVDGFVGAYVADTSQRRPWTLGAPVFVSSEDFVALMSDRDQSRFEEVGAPGLPLGVQVEVRMYAWGESFLRDVVLLRYAVTNTGDSTLYDCYLGLGLDADIGFASNDHGAIAIADPAQDSLDLCALWSETEALGRFGYLGVDVVDSPERDASGFVRGRDGIVRTDERLGLTTFQNRSIESDPATSADRYAAMRSGARDVDAGRGDFRQLVATGPVHLRPGDTATATFALMFAMNPGANPPTGTWADMAPLVDLDRRVQSFYDRAFTAAMGFAAAPNAPPRDRTRALRLAPSPAGAALGASRAVASFELEEESAASVEIIDVRGERMSAIDLGRLGRGAHRVGLDVAGFPSGVYFVVVRTGAGARCERLVIQQ